MPFSGNTFINVAGATSAAPGQIVQSAIWDAIFADYESALTQVMNQFNAGPVSIAGVGTTQAGAAAITGLQFYVRANAQAGQYALVMTASAQVGNRYEIFNSGAATLANPSSAGGSIGSSSASNTGSEGISTSGITGSFSGAAQGGSSQQFSNLPPAIITNKIIYSGV